jgi:hypothetical protein
MRFVHARTGRSDLRNPSLRSPAALLGLALLAIPGSARADGDALVGQSRGEPVPVPLDAPRRAPAGEPLPASQGRIFVNFDGATLTDGWDDATANVTQIGECAGNFAAYGEGAKRDAVMQAVRDDWSAYNVIIVDERPDSGDSAAACWASRRSTATTRRPTTTSPTRSTASTTASMPRPPRRRSARRSRTRMGSSTSTSPATS